MKPHYLIEYGYLPKKSTAAKNKTIHLSLTDFDNDASKLSLSFSFSTDKNKDDFIFLINKGLKAHVSLTLKEIHFLYSLCERDLQRL